MASLLDTSFGALPKLNPPELDDGRAKDEVVFLLLSSPSESCLRLDLLALLPSTSSSVLVGLKDEDDVVPKFKGGMEGFFAAGASSFPSLLVSTPNENLLEVEFVEDAPNVKPVEAVVEVEAVLSIGFEVPKEKPLLLPDPVTSAVAGCCELDEPNVNPDGLASVGAEDVAPNSNFPLEVVVEFVPLLDDVGATPNVNPLVLGAGVGLVSLLLLAAPNENPPLPIPPVVVVVVFVPNWNLGGSDEEVDDLLVDDPELPPSNGLSHEAHLSKPFSFCTKHTLHLTLLETIFQILAPVLDDVSSFFVVVIGAAGAELVASNAVSQETHLLAFLSL